MAYQSESALENKLIEQLVSKGYQWVPEVRSEATMIANFRTILETRNSANIGDEPLTDKEFDRLMTQINGKSIFDSAKILRDKALLKRDNGKNLYLELFNTKEWCKNTFQVTNQISMEGKYANRYDVTILINGLPLVQVELKRSGVDMTEAFNQIMRYRKHTYTGLFRYIQVFVISNSQETRYFSNSDGEILKSQMFYWSDVDNNRINLLNEFTDSFMEKCRLAKMLACYMVLNETDKILMVMRPYQVYAVEALVRQALETRNNGYIWHTTGSGKTLTSFKASQIIAQEEGIEKVFFLVDRRDLDSQTLAEFNKFEADSVDMTDNTYTLLKQMGDKTKPLILTTIQKMANALQMKALQNQVQQIADQIVVIDYSVREVIKGQQNDRIGLYYSGLTLYLESQNINDQELKKALIAQSLRALSEARFQFGLTMQSDTKYLAEGNYRIGKGKSVALIDSRIDSINQSFAFIHQATMLRAGIYCNVGELTAMSTVLNEYSYFIDGTIAKNAGLLAQCDRTDSGTEKGIWKSRAKLKLDVSEFSKLLTAPDKTIYLGVSKENE